MPSCAKAIVLPALPPWWNGASPPLTRCFRIYAVRSHTASARDCDDRRDQGVVPNITGL